MKLIERYIFGRMLGAASLNFLALSTMMWLALALRQFELVASQGQSLWTFLNVSAYLVPLLVMIVLPVSVLIGVIYTLNTLNGESELAVINASGASQGAMLKPVFLIGSITALLVGAMSLYFTPLSLRLGQSLIAQVRGNIANSIVREGQFVSLGGGLTFHVKGRLSDGSFLGIFISDDRDAEQTITYIAERGAVIDNPLGLFLVMEKGTIQQRSKIDERISMIEFTNYGFDLSSLANKDAAPSLQPQQRPTGYLLHPDSDDPFFVRSPEQFAAEFHDRATSPLYGLVFALIPLAFLAQAQSARQSRAANVGLAVITVLVVKGAGFLAVHTVRTNAAAAVFLYTIPLTAISVTVLIVLSGLQLKPPARLVAFGEAALNRVSGLTRGRSITTAAEGG